MRCDVVDPPDDAVGTTAGPPGRPDDGAWVLAARAGDPDAFGRLFDRWFDPVYDVAWRIVRNRDTAAEVAQDVFLAAWQGLDGLERPASFGGWVRRIARNRALNRLERERRSVPDDEQAAGALDRSAPEVDMTAGLGEREQQALVWAAASALGERDASLLDLHLRHGLGAVDIADELGVTANNAHQLLHRLKSKLAGAVRAWVLWRDGGRGCDGLDAALTGAGLTAFGAEAVRVVGRHVQGCETCAERQQLRVAPEALFAAMPIMVAPAMLRVEAAAALGEAGVPMAGSATAGAAGTAGAGGSAGEGAGDGGADGAPHDAGSAGGAGGGGGTGDTGSGVADGPEPGAGPDGVGASGPAAPGRRRAMVTVGAGVLFVLVAGLAGVGLAGLGGGNGGDGSDAAEISGARPEAAAPTPGGAKSLPSQGGGPGGAKLPPASTTTTDAEPDDPTTTATAPTGEPTPPPPDPPDPDPDPAPDPPVIGGFRATAGGSCSQDPAERTVSLAWQSSGGDAASLAGPDGSAPVDPSGTATMCVVTPASFTLTVTGPGGSDEATATAR